MLSPLDVPSVTTKLVAVELNTLEELKLVVEPMLPIWVRMFWYSWLAELDLTAGEGAVGGLGGQGDCAIEQVGDLGERAVRGLQEADAVGGICGGLGERGYVGAEAVGDGEAGCVVGAGVDARTGGELLESGLKARLGGVEVVLSVEGGDVVEDA